jgi:hypothetical protein
MEFGVRRGYGSGGAAVGCELRGASRPALVRVVRGSLSPAPLSAWSGRARTRRMPKGDGGAANPAGLGSPTLLGGKWRGEPRRDLAQVEDGARGAGLGSLGAAGIAPTPVCTLAGGSGLLDDRAAPEEADRNRRRLTGACLRAEPGQAKLLGSWAVLLSGRPTGWRSRSGA